MRSALKFSQTVSVARRGAKFSPTSDKREGALDLVMVGQMVVSQMSECQSKQTRQDCQRWRSNSCACRQHRDRQSTLQESKDQHCVFTCSQMLVCSTGPDAPSPHELVLLPCQDEVANAACQVSLQRSVVGFEDLSWDPIATPLVGVEDGGANRNGTKNSSLNSTLHSQARQPRT